MSSSSESWKLQQHPRLWHSRAGGGAVHSIKSGHRAPAAPSCRADPCRLLNCLQRLRQFLVQSALVVLAELLWLENNGQFRERAGKGKRHFALILFQHRGSRVLSYVERFIEREANADGLGNATLRDLLFVHQ